MNNAPVRARRSGQEWWLAARVAAVGALFTLAAGCGQYHSAEPTTTARSTTTRATTTTTSAKPTTVAPTTSAPTTVAPTAPPTAAPVGPAVVVSSGPASRREVALTFDAGSDRGYAAKILDTLKANGTAATFGLTGTWSAANPDLVARIAREGHQILDHTYDHKSFTGRSTATAPLSFAQRADELRRGEQAILAAGGSAAAPWFRPPYGDIDSSVLADVARVGYRYVVMWTVDSLGWKGLSAGDIRERCLDSARPGAIYLFHVGAQSQDAFALQGIIDALDDDGYGFVTVRGMLS